MSDKNQRKADYPIDPMFIERWSPRSFDGSELSEKEILTLFEAARWAPSCFNEQPWRYYYAAKPSSRKQFVALLRPKNQTWAQNASVIAFAAVKKYFNHNGKENRYAPFDCGAAWVSLAFQARKMGLYAHAMAGFDREKAFEKLNLSKEQYEIMAAIAIGRHAIQDILPEDLQKIEHPNSRKPQKDFAFEFEDNA